MASPLEGVTLTYASINSIRMRYASAGPVDGPLCLFLHGWPESWYSWRHQLLALSKEGYYCVAPDMRGYGGTDAPTEKEQYTISHIRDVMIGLVKHLRHETCFLIGHDWGAWATWFVTHTSGYGRHNLFYSSFVPAGGWVYSGQMSLWHSAP